MNAHRSRHRTDLSAVAASACRFAASAMDASVAAMDSAARAVDDARDKAARKRDPKALHLRRLRSARSAVNGWAATTSTGAAVTASGFVVAGPAVGSVAAAATMVVAVPTVYAARRLRRLGRTPAPPRAYTRRALPARWSALHHPVARLAAAEQEFLALLGLLHRSGALAPQAIAELDSDAEVSADAIASYADQLAGLEHLVRRGGASASTLTAALADGIEGLDQGVAAYVDMVESAASAFVASRHAAGSPSALSDIGQAAPRLQETADRLRAWASALSDLPPVPGYR